MARRIPAEELTRHHEFLRALARGLVGDGNAEDLVQDAYVAALERPPRSLGALRGWLAQVVKRRSINAVRGASRRSSRELSVARGEAVPSHAEVAERLEISRQVIEVVQQMPEAQRWVIYRRHFDGRSTASIAAELGVSRETVKTRLRRALESVRAELDARAGGDRARWLTALIPLAVPPTGIGLFPATKLASLPTGSAAGGAGVLGGALLMKKFAVSAGIVALILGAVYTSDLLDQAPAPAADASPSTAVALVDPPAERSAAEPLLASPAGPATPRRAAETAPPPSPSTPGTCELVVTATWESDGTPAAGVEVLVEPNGRAPGADTRRAVTDDEGSARFAGLLPAEVRFHGFRGGYGGARIEAGAVTAAELRVPAGYDVEGVVVSPSGVPVPGAEVWIRQPGPGWLAGRIAATTDANGRFSLRSVEMDRMIAARAEGYGPSIVERLERLEPAPGEPVRLQLALRGSGGAIEGTVVDSEGRPVAGARVVVGNSLQHAQRGDGSYDLLAPPIAVTTDEAGRFSARPVAAALVELAAWDAGRPIARAIADVQAGKTARAALRFEAPVVVAGTVRDAGGEPVPGARVTLEQVDAATYRATPFVAPSAFADGQGRYELGGLPAGDLGVLAEDTGTGAGEGRVVIAGAPGDRLGADIPLSPLSAIRGRLVDASGGALAGWLVSADGPRENGRAHTAEDGSFAVAVQGAGPFTIGVSVETGPRPALVVVAENVAPGGPDLLLELPADKAASAFVVGRFEDRGGRVDPQERVNVGLWATTQSIAMVEVVDGTFRVGPVAPGTYTLQFMAGSRMITSAGPLALEAGAELDVGTVCTEVPGSLALDVEISGEFAKPLANVQLIAVDFALLRFQPLTHQDGGFFATEVAPGNYQLLALETEVCVESAPFAVRSGEETLVHAKASAGAFCSVELELPEDAASITRMHIVVTSPDGGMVLDYEGPPQGRDGDAGIARAFPVGTSHVAFTTDAGLAGECDVVVSESDVGEQKQVVLALE